MGKDGDLVVKGVIQQNLEWYLVSPERVTDWIQASQEKLKILLNLEEKILANQEEEETQTNQKITNLQLVELLQADQK